MGRSENWVKNNWRKLLKKKGVSSKISIQELEALVKDWLDQLKGRIELQGNPNQLILPKISKTSDLNFKNSAIMDKPMEQENPLLKLEINKKPTIPIQDCFNDEDMIPPQIYDNGIYQIIKGNNNSISDIDRSSKA